MTTTAWIGMAAALALTVPASLPAAAQEPAAARSPGPQAPTRAIKGKPVPYVENGRLLVYQGDIIVFSVGPDGGAPVFVMAGKAAEDHRLAAGELRASLDGGMLTIESGHSRWLNYSAGLSSGGRPRPTTVCTIMAGKMAFESWQDRIAYLSLGEFTPAPDGSLVCR